MKPVVVPLKATTFVPVKPAAEILTIVPTGLLVGEKEVRGTTVKLTGLVALPVAVSQPSQSTEAFRVPQ